MFNFIRGLFKPKFEVTLYLKGGQTVKLKVLSFNAKRNGMNELTSLEWELADSSKILYTRLDDISFIHSTRTI